MCDPTPPMLPLFLAAAYCVQSGEKMSENLALFTRRFQKLCQIMFRINGQQASDEWQTAVKSLVHHWSATSPKNSVAGEVVALIPKLFVHRDREEERGGPMSLFYLSKITLGKTCSRIQSPLD